MEMTKKGKASDYLKAAGLGILAVMLFYIIQFLAIAGIIFVRIFLSTGRAGGSTWAVHSYNHIQSPEFLTSAAAVMTALTTLVFGIWYKCKYGGKSVKTRLQHFQKYVLTGKNILVFLLLGPACYFVEIEIANIIGLVSPETMKNYLESMENITGGSQLVMFIFVALLAPVGEECLFRGLLLKKYLVWLPVVPAIIMQTVFFGIVHMNFVQGIYVMVFGMVSGYVAYRCKSVLPSIFIHFINNTIPSVFRVIPETVLNNTVLWTAAGITVIVLLIVVIKYMPGELLQVPEETDLEREAAV